MSTTNTTRPAFLKYHPALKGHYFPGVCKAEFESAAFIWNGGTTPSAEKMANPEFKMDQR